MEPARPLRDVFADLVTDEDVRRAHAADPDGFLQAHGHTELPGQLVSEAIVNYADTAPAEVAEHLAPFVMAHSPVPIDDGTATGAEVADGLQLLATAPADPYLDELPDDSLDGTELAGQHHAADFGVDTATHDPFDLDFGHGEMIDAGHDGAHLLGSHVDETHVDDALADLAHGHDDPGHVDAGDLDGGQLEPGHGWLGSADGAHELVDGHAPAEHIGTDHVATDHVATDHVADGDTGDGDIADL